MTVIFYPVTVTGVHTARFAWPWEKHARPLFGQPQKQVSTSQHTLGLPDLEEPRQTPFGQPWKQVSYEVSQHKQDQDMWMLQNIAQFLLLLFLEGV